MQVFWVATPRQQTGYSVRTEQVLHSLTAIGYGVTGNKNNGV